MAASTIITIFSTTATARRLAPAFPPPSKSKSNIGKRAGEFVGLPLICFVDPWWPPCDWWRHPEANLTHEVAFENRMQEEMTFQCDGDSLHFTVHPGKTVGRFYDVQLPKISCAWGYAGNFMSGVTVWDEMWPEAKLCRDDLASANGECIRLVFDNKEVFLLTRAGANKRVLGGLPVKVCGGTAWYQRMLPWTQRCIYPENSLPYVGKVRDSWVSAVLNKDN
ncbi:hypothetical protein GUJ93_ZPchr0005g14865 [Zizania palustris]|nr:hypothetical protein GUJ93_ZPchr0005g14865 [Zizania palustris]